MKNNLKKKAQEAQENLLNIIEEVFRDTEGWIKKAPSYITNEAGLFKKLYTKGNHEMKEGQNHRLAQALINELLNRRRLKHKKDKGYQYIGN